MNLPLPGPLRSGLFRFGCRFSAAPAARAFLELERNQRLPPDALLALNWRKRRDLLRYAFATIPFYRDRYAAAGLREKDFDDPAVWDAVPLLTRKDVAEQFDRILAPGWPADRMHESTTGGTTGIPLRVMHDDTFPGAAIRWRMLGWWGVTPTDSQGRVGRFTHAELQSRGKLRKAREPRLSVSRMDEDALRRFVEDWNRQKPRLLSGYVAGIQHAAGFIRERGLRIHAPAAIQVTTAPLTARVRRMIQDAFRAPVYDQYGSCEIYWLAAECRRQDGLHVFADVRHLECVAGNGRSLPPGEEGRLVTTDLENRAFPLIRYVNGDLGRMRPGHCPCGSSLPLMDPVKGRITEYVTLPDGAVIGGVYLTTLFDPWPDAVLAFQVRQKADFSIDLRVVPNPRDPQSAVSIDRVLTVLREKTRGAVPVTVVRETALESANGKTRYIVSDVPA